MTNIDKTKGTISYDFYGKDITVITHDFNSTIWRDETKRRCRITKVKCIEPKFNIRIGIILGILKNFGYSRRIIRNIEKILSEEEKRMY